LHRSLEALAEPERITAREKIATAAAASNAAPPIRTKIHETAQSTHMTASERMRLRPSRSFATGS
jgi:hypothetical protein